MTAFQKRLQTIPSIVWLLIAALLLRLYNLDAEPIWTDEADVLSFSLASWSELFSDFSTPGHNGPLYYVVVKAWLSMIGGSLIELRLLSVLCGSLCMMPAYWLGQRLDAKRGGLYVCLLMATSPHLIWYAKDGKMYSLLLLLTMLSSLLLIHLFETKRWIFGLGYGVLIVVSWYIHLLSALILPVHLIYVLSQQTKEVRRKLLLGGSVAGIAGGWYLLNWHVSAERITLNWQTFPALLADTLQTQLFVFSTGFPNFWQYPAILLYFGLLGWGLRNIYHTQGTQQSHSMGLAVYFFVPIIGMAILRTVVGVYATRYLITIAPAFYGLATLALLKIPPPFSYVALISALLLNLLAI